MFTLPTPSSNIIYSFSSIYSLFHAVLYFPDIFVKSLLHYSLFHVDVRVKIQFFRIEAVLHAGFVDLII